ncbi:MAG: hypothetical protein WBQ73_02885 [Candidatus Babeliales bacterium]
MKSIIEQSSSVIKAIEKAWVEAEKPKNFTIKIFQEGEKNFFGFTKTYAKIALFCEETASTSDRDSFNKTQQREPKTSSQQRKKSPKKSEYSSVWSEDMVANIREWLTALLTFIDKNSVLFTIEAKHYVLKINFAQSLFDNKEQESALLRSLSYLFAQMIRSSYRKNLRNIKLVLSCPS